MEKATAGEEEFAEMICYYLEDVSFGLHIGPDGYYVPALSGRGGYKGTPRTMDEEYDLMAKQVTETQGFDMDFSQFRYDFNYRPVDFDDNSLVIDGETMRDLVNRLSRKSLELYNQEKKTRYELVEVSKANYHMAGAGMMFFITFQAKEDSDVPKTFQAKSHYSCFSPNRYITCDLKAPPEKKSILWTVIQTVFVPYANDHPEKGFPLPVIHGFTLEKAEIICSSSEITVCSDVAYLDSSQQPQSPTLL